MSQTVTMLRALREAGPAGIHTFELRRRLFIGNPSQRYFELKEMGHEIAADPEKLHGTATGTRYTLVHDAGGSGDRAEWLRSQQASGDAAVDAWVVTSMQVEPELIEGELGLRLFAPPSDPRWSDQYGQEAA